MCFSIWLLTCSQSRNQVSCVMQWATDHPSIDGISSFNGTLNVDSSEVQSTFVPYPFINFMLDNRTPIISEDEHCCVPEFKQVRKMRNAIPHEWFYANNCQVSQHMHRINRCLTTMVLITLKPWVVWSLKE